MLERPGKASRSHETFQARHEQGLPAFAATVACKLRCALLPILPMDRLQDRNRTWDWAKGWGWVWARVWA